MLGSQRLKRRRFLELGLQGGLVFLVAGHHRYGSRERTIHEAVDPRLQWILDNYGGEFGGKDGPALEEDHVRV